MFGLSLGVRNVPITPGFVKCYDYPRVKEITHRVGEMFGLPKGVGNVLITPE
jgi:hypothetical protein